MYHSPIKNVEFHYKTSLLSETIGDAHVYPDALGSMLGTIGMDRKAMVDFLRSFVGDHRYLAVDLTHILSMSENVISSMLGHNSMDELLPQVQLLFLFSLDRDAPTYFRILPGSINSVASLKLSMEESSANRIVLVSDTGFYSKSNISSLDSMGISYIIPLKRNSKLISYDSEGGKHFMFQDHTIFYSKYSSSGETMFTFRNYFLKAEEEKYFLGMNKSTKRFTAIRDRMGTISVITNLKVPGEIVYGMLKSRTDIEQSYDTFKNTIHADRTYMRNDQQMQGWTFVNFIALIIHYRIYSLLKSKDLLKKYSPVDVIQHMSRIFMLRIGEEWKISEIPKKSRSLMEGLDIPIMQKSWS
ncbi:MAG: transposase [Thermoplasmatales archaeon]